MSRGCSVNELQQLSPAHALDPETSQDRTTHNALHQTLNLAALPVDVIEAIALFQYGADYG